MQQFDCPQPAAGAWLLLLLTANVESCCSSFAVWHFGHCGFCSPKRMASNLCPHSSQRYSKIGILAPISLAPLALHFPSPSGEWYNHYRCSTVVPTFSMRPARKAWLAGQRLRIAPRRQRERTTSSANRSARGGCSLAGTLRPSRAISGLGATICRLQKNVCFTWKPTSRSCAIAIGSQTARRR